MNRSLSKLLLVAGLVGSSGCFPSFEAPSSTSTGRSGGGNGGANVASSSGAHFGGSGVTTGNSSNGAVQPSTGGGLASSSSGGPCNAEKWSLQIKAVEALGIGQAVAPTDNIVKAIAVQGQHVLVIYKSSNATTAGSFSVAHDTPTMLDIDLETGVIARAPQVANGECLGATTFQFVEDPLAKGVTLHLLCGDPSFVNVYPVDAGQVGAGETFCKATSGTINSATLGVLHDHQLLAMQTAGSIQCGTNSYSAAASPTVFVIPLSAPTQDLALTGKGITVGRIGATQTSGGVEFLLSTYGADAVMTPIAWDEGSPAKPLLSSTPIDLFSQSTDPDRPTALYPSGAAQDRIFYAGFAEDANSTNRSDRGGLAFPSEQTLITGDPKDAGIIRGLAAGTGSMVLFGDTTTTPSPFFPSCPSGSGPCPFFALLGNESELPSAMSAKTYAGNGIFTAASNRVGDSDGSFIIGGTFSGPLDMGCGTLQSASGEEDVILARIEP